MGQWRDNIDVPHHPFENFRMQSRNRSDTILIISNDEDSNTSPAGNLSEVGTWKKIFHWGGRAVKRHYWSASQSLQLSSHQRNKEIDTWKVAAFSDSIRRELSLSSTPYPPGNTQKCILPFAVFLPSKPSRCSIESLILRMPMASVTLGPDPPQSHDIMLITIWPCPLSLSSALFFYSSNNWSPVSLSHCMALDIMQTSNPEALHPTSCESFCDSMGPFLFCCCGSPSYQEEQHFFRTPHQISYTGVVGHWETLMGKCLTIPSAFLKEENWILASGNTYSQWLSVRGTLPSPAHAWWCHKEVGGFVWPRNVASQPHEETSLCLMNTCNLTQEEGGRGQSCSPIRSLHPQKVERKLVYQIQLQVNASGWHWTFCIPSKTCSSNVPRMAPHGKRHPSYI